MGFQWEGCGYPDAHPLNLFRWDLHLKLEYQHSPAFPPLLHRPLCTPDLMSRFFALLTEEQLSSSSTKIWRVRFFRYSFCFTSLICLKVKEKGKRYNFPTKFEKDPKIWMGHPPWHCNKYRLIMTYMNVMFIVRSHTLTDFFIHLEPKD